MSTGTVHHINNGGCKRGNYGEEQLIVIINLVVRSIRPWHKSIEDIIWSKTPPLPVLRASQLKHEVVDHSKIVHQGAQHRFYIIRYLGVRMGDLNSTRAPF